jgi:hypothetical protein
MNNKPMNNGNIEKEVEVNIIMEIEIIIVVEQIIIINNQEEDHVSHLSNFY